MIKFKYIMNSYFKISYLNMTSNKKLDFNVDDIITKLIQARE